METVVWILGSVLLVSLLSLAGALALFFDEKKIRKYLLLLVSFSAGTLFGDAFIHLLPEAFDAGESPVLISLTVLSGILVFFVLERVVHWHHAHHVEGDCEHEHVKTLGIMNLVGDGVHNFIDGMIIAGSFMVSVPLGIATTIAVIFHEIPQEISDFGVLLHAGYSKAQALFYNFLSALAAVAGALLVIVLQTSIPSLETRLLAFTAGGFIYIAGTDLIPELRKENHPHQTVLQLAALALGMSLMLAIALLE